MDIKDIRKIRRQLNLTQQELARQAAVSQSLIAKIERGLTDPSYSLARKIITTLEELTNKTSIRAKGLYTPKIISVHPKTQIKQIIRKMRKNEISQIVVQKTSIMGMITEKQILASIEKPEARAEDIMEESPPSVNMETELDTIKTLLKNNQLLIVTEKGKPKGVITPTDLLEKAI